MLRTRVYIDGYNFYYGCLKGTSHKWLDLVKLFKDKILPSITAQPNGAQRVSKIWVYRLSLRVYVANDKFQKVEDCRERNCHHI